VNSLSFQDVENAYLRIKDYIQKTPVISNTDLDKYFGAKIYFKMESGQKTKSFKERGAFNSILAYKEKHGFLPKKISVSSSGNHAQAMARVAKEFGIEVVVYMITKASPLKIQNTRDLGAKVILCERRSEANRLAKEKEQEGYHYVHPADGDYVISGQGTACLEALREIGEVDAVFAPCGGGGLVSGSYLATTGLSKNAKVFACEPLNANDVAKSVRENKIFSFEDTPDTIADGARTLAPTEQAFEYLKKLAGILEIPEEKISFWQKKFYEITNHKIETTSALVLAGIEQYLSKNNNIKNQKILAIISGGNANL